VTYLFSRANRRVFDDLADADVLLAFDFDGTMAPLRNEPDRAALRSSTRELLRRACRLYPCVIVSGRARADVERRLRGVGIRLVVGNHGAELHADQASVRRRVGQWLSVLKTHLPPNVEVTIENKDLSIALHYRHARDTRAARRAILTAVRSLPGVRVVGGALAVNLLLRDAPHKGKAVEALRARLRCDRVVYVGDDATDEDAFGQGPPSRLISIRVGRSRNSAATYYIREQREIDRLLQALVARRS